MVKVRDRKRKSTGNQDNSAKWRDINLVLIYRFLKAGMDDQDIAERLGCSRVAFWQWKKNRKAMQELYTLVEKEKDKEHDLKTWVFKRLSPELQKLWKKVNRIWQEDNAPRKIDLLFADHGRLARQQLFLNALCRSNFNASKAMRKVNITKNTMDEWIKTDPDFLELVNEIQWHKGNYIEDSLLQLVRQGETAAVIFANKTLNAERGYGIRSKIDMNVNGTIQHDNSTDLMEIAELMSESGKQELLVALKKLKDRDRLTQAKSVSAVINTDPITCVSEQIGYASKNLQTA